MAIDNISDTARWVAVYRAQETARPDAIFRDPFAERLAGERGDSGGFPDMRCWSGCKDPDLKRPRGAALERSVAPGPAE